MPDYATSAEVKARRERKFKAQGGLCRWCGKEMSLEPMHTTEKGRVKHNPKYASFEHLTRRRDGGLGKPNNVVLAHASCNRKRENSWNESGQTMATE